MPNEKYRPKIPNEKYGTKNPIYLDKMSTAWFKTCLPQNDGTKAWNYPECWNCQMELQIAKKEPYFSKIS